MDSLFFCWDLSSQLAAVSPGWQVAPQGSSIGGDYEVFCLFGGFLDAHPILESMEEVTSCSLPLFVKAENCSSCRQRVFWGSIIWEGECAGGHSETPGGGGGAKLQGWYFSSFVYLKAFQLFNLRLNSAGSWCPSLGHCRTHSSYSANSPGVQVSSEHFNVRDVW